MERTTDQDTKDRDTADRAARPGTRPTALIHGAAFAGHDTGGHPENPDRYRAVVAELARLGLLEDRPSVTFGPASTSALTRVHDAGYVATIDAVAAEGGAWLDADTLVAPDSPEVARLASGAAIAGVNTVLDGDARRAFALGRPPGHHATPARGMGFCLFNHVAVAAAHGLERGLIRVAIVDWDVHHGNGTQDAFYDDDRVFFCSLHQSPHYPYTGAAKERGRGPGEGFTLNIPLPAAQGDADYLRLFERRVAPALRDFRPELILVSAGFDAHAADPLGGMMLTAQGFAALARAVAALAEDLCGGRLVAVLEGGYDLPATAASVAAVVAALDEG